MTTGVVVVAAGSGRRFGGRLPKQFRTLGGEPLLMRSLRVFASVGSVKEIAVAAEPAHFARLRRLSKRLPKRIRFTLVPGGRFRGESVSRAFRALQSNPDVVLVHDAARPMVTADIVRRVAAAAKAKGAALAAWPLPDTLKLAGRGGRVRKTVPRRNLWLAQTPQGFRRDVARLCLSRPSATATDDAELAERAGRPVQLVAGHPTNLKVTLAHDLAICRALVR